MLHSSFPTAAGLSTNIAARDWADAQIERMRAEAADKLRALARHDWALYSRLANIPRPAPRMPAREIIERVAAWHSVPVADVMSRSMRHIVIQARFDAIAAVKHAYPLLSLPKLGQIFRRDHSSIFNALQVRGVSCSRAKV